MPTPEYPRAPRTSRRPAWGVVNRHSEHLEALRDPVLPDGGLAFGVPSMPPVPEYCLLAVITGLDEFGSGSGSGSGDGAVDWQGPAYSWVRAVEMLDGDAEEPDYPDGYGGDAAYMPAFEDNGNPNVPAGTKVYLRPSQGGNYWRFHYPDLAAADLTARLSDLSVTVAPTRTLTFDFAGFYLEDRGDGEAFVAVKPGSSITVINNFETVYQYIEWPDDWQGTVKDEVTRTWWLRWRDGTVCKIPLECPPSGSGSGAGSGAGDCVPGDCADYCAEAPAYWDLPASGFTGAKAAFNGDWRLLPDPDQACAWAARRVVNTQLVTVRLTTPGGGPELAFLLGDDLAPAAEANYVADWPPGDPPNDCCRAYTFAAAVGGCAGAGACPAALTATPYCCPADPAPPPVAACACAAVAQTLYLTVNETLEQITLTYDPGDQKWKGSGTACGTATGVEFYCYASPSWALEFDGDYGVGNVTDTNNPTDCDPFQWTSAVPMLENDDCPAGSSITVSDLP